MSTIPFITAADVESQLSWNAVMEALVKGHRLGRADIDDILFKRQGNSLLNRAAWIAGMGIGVKSATIFPGNQGQTPSLPNVNAVFTLFEDNTGLPIALIDGTFLTKWKTAGDSILGSRLLARPDSQVLTILGAGAVAESLVEAYREAFPNLEQVYLWNRTASKAQDCADKLSSEELPVSAVTDLAFAITQADILSSATMALDPFIKGAMVQPGTHVDLIGAFRPDMREADDELLLKAQVFVDARETTIHDIGELKIPISQGVISEEDVMGDLYDLCNGTQGRSSAEEITLFKNGGGAHLDLMTACYIKDCYQS